MFDATPVGLVLILIAGVLIFLGIGQRVLDRMRLTDTQALVILGVMLLGAFLPEVRLGRAVSLDLGGALVPLGIAVYLIASAGTKTEKWRAVSAMLVTAGLVYAADKLIPSDPGRVRFPIPLDATLLPGIIAGVVAYLFGRSRRSAFIAGTMGVILVDVINVMENAFRRVPGAFNAIGGAGVFDASIVAGFIAVFLAEVVGEGREFLRGGPSGDRPAGLLRGLRGRVLVGAEGGERGGGGRGQDGAGGAAEARVPFSIMAAAVALAGLTAATAGILGGRLHTPDEVLAGPIFTVQDEAGHLIMQTGRWIHVGDEYIDEANQRYRVDRVRGRLATARFLGIEEMPVLNLPAVGDGGGVAVAGALVGGARGKAPGAQRDVTVGIYHTHNDESYIATQGTSAIEGKGGIHRVGDTLGDALRKKGYKVVHDQTIHLPHDDGAYRRSRRTANKLLRKEGADLLFDVHRDAGPPSMYAKKVDGKWVTQVRLVVGSPNPQQGSVMAYAKELKAVADKTHPGLIKGIFVGRDAYNQDLTPRNILLEVGTEQNAMPSAQKGIALFADVVDRWLDTRGRK